MRKQVFLKYSYYQLIILLLIIILVSFLFVTLAGTLFGSFIFHYDLNSIQDGIFSEPAILKYFQTIQSISLFIIPPLLFTKICFENPVKWLTLNRRPETIIIIATIILTLVAQPFISFTGVLNNNITFPSWLKEVEEWMRLKESEAQLATDTFLLTNSWWESIFNIILIAIIPAFGEELLFRGALQKLIIKSTKKVHLSIWITAILFSALHIQFFGFIPRFILGLLFGYLVVYFDSIWLGIAAHFTNNFAAYLIYKHAATNKGIETSQNIMNETPSLTLTILSISGIILIGIALYLYRQRYLDKSSFED